MRTRRLFNRALRRLRGAELPVWHDPAYRPPLPGLDHTAGMETRRADYVLWLLLETGAIRPRHVRAPRKAGYDELLLVHDSALLESLGRAETLADIFAVTPQEVPVSELLGCIRLACGGTIEAAFAALERRGPTLNLLGGFHHAAPDRAAGFSALNDVAVAVAVLRRQGFAGSIAVIDVDAHPPDGIAECLHADEGVWIGSLSGPSWEAPARVDETKLPKGCVGKPYLRALRRLLDRMPKPELAFVLAGGDVLAGDGMGELGLDLASARQRDRTILRALHDLPSVWLPAGGYHPDAWRVLANTALELALGPAACIPPQWEPLRARFAFISGKLTRPDDHGPQADPNSMVLSAEEIEEALGMGTAGRYRLLGLYTAEWLEYAFEAYGVLGHARRLGYGNFEVRIKRHDTGGQMQVIADPKGARHVLIEAVLEAVTHADRRLLYVHWLTLRHPAAAFSSQRPRLPGQEVPGLGLARESGELLAVMARRLQLAGVAFRPAAYHVAWTARYDFCFVDPARQGRFEALQAVLADRPLREASALVATGRVLLNGAPYAWEADPMVFWLEGSDAAPAAQVQAARDAARFTLERAPAGPAAPARGVAGD